jgi:ankyrin repeat protein
MTNYPKYTNPADLKSALIQAADGDIDWVKELLKDGADPNGMPFIMAIQSDEPTIVQMMIDAGAEVNAHFAGTTPLIRAIQGCHLEVFKVLMNAGADVNLKDGNLQSPLSTARGSISLDVSKGKQKIMVKLLLDAGAHE